MEKIFPTETAQQKYLRRHLGNSDCCSAHLLVYQDLSEHPITSML